MFKHLPYFSCTLLIYPLLECSVRKFSQIHSVVRSCPGPLYSLAGQEGYLPLPILAYHFAPSSRNLGSAPVLNTVRMCADFLKTCRPTVFVSGGDSFFNLI